MRDYIHVQDLATAHLDALSYLRGGGASTTLNVGYGHGYSVRQVLASVERVSGKRLTVRESRAAPVIPRPWWHGPSASAPSSAGSHGSMTST